MTGETSLSPVESVFLRWYERIFSIGEIAGNTTLQWVLGATIFSHFVIFNSWFTRSATTIDAYLNGSYVCPSYFQNCGPFLFLRTLPEGYSQPLLYMLLYATLLLSIYLIYRKQWVYAHIALFPSFIWHTLASFVFTASLSGNYDYYLFALTFVFLFLPHKEFFLKALMVLLYALSTVAKIHETWIVGSYFSALKTGLPLFPDWSIPFFTNLVIGMEMVGAWFLLSRRVLLQRAVLVFFTLFHLYSGLLVRFKYPSVVLPTLLILFGPFYRYINPPMDRRSIAGWLLLGSLLCIQIAPLAIPGDAKMTLEGDRYGLYMFEANHQCVSITDITYKNGTHGKDRLESTSAHRRCDPYRYWFQLHTLCIRTGTSIKSIKWTFDHSINGGPFLRIIDVSNACMLQYNAFQHNEWIRIHDAPIIGYPVENIYG